MLKAKVHFMKIMQKIDQENRFEKILYKYKEFLKPLNYLIKLVGIVIILLVLLELFSFLALNTYISAYNFIKYGAKDSRVNIDVYKDKEWAPEYFQEEREVSKGEYYPYVGYRRVPNFNGKYINLDKESIRKTINPCLDNSKEKIKIFAFGGSTMWGTGSRDQGTIPSYLSQLLCEKGYNVEVTNFGESGYTNTQEMIRLQLELRKGNIPDIVIFYDGVNDVYSSFQNRIAGFPQNIENRKKEFNSKDKFNINGLFPNFYKILGIVKRKLSKKRVSDKNLNVETAKVYINNIKIIRSLEDDFKFKSFFYWQPSIYTKKNLSEDEKTKINYDETLYLDYNMVSDLVNNMSNDVISLTSIFDSEERTIFIDWSHISEDGNLIIAQKMADDIHKYLSTLDDE